jgi:hypothetical protein
MKGSGVRVPASALLLSHELSHDRVGWDRTEATFAVDPGMRATRRMGPLEAKKEARLPPPPSSTPQVRPAAESRNIDAGLRPTP